MVINGFLMNRDIRVAEIVDNETVVLNEKLALIIFARGGGLVEWIESRAIDRRRINSRLLKKALGITDTSDISTVMQVNAAAVTDTYWIKEKGSDLCFDDVKFNENPFADLALKGDIDSFVENCGAQGRACAPDLTTVGSFEKCWRKSGGCWWLYKSGNDLERFSELFVARLGAAVGFDMAHYETEGDYIKTRDFTKGGAVIFEPAYNLVGDNKDYAYNYKKIAGLNLELAKQYIDILVMDTLCFNLDRHTFNYGFLRDSETGDFISMAPNFDNNAALISRGYRKNPFCDNDILFSAFADFIKSSNLRFRLPLLNRKMVDEILFCLDFNVDKRYVSEYVLYRYGVLCKIYENFCV